MYQYYTMQILCKRYLTLITDYKKMDTSEGVHARDAFFGDYENLLFEVHSDSRKGDDTNPDVQPSSISEVTLFSLR